MQEMSSPRGKASYLHNVRIIVIATLAVTLCYPALINTAAVRSEKQLQQFLLRDSRDVKISPQSLEESDEEDEAKRICHNACGWAVYNPYARNVEYFMKNPCECPDESYKCVRVEDDLSASAYVYRCRQKHDVEKHDPWRTSWVMGQLFDPSLTSLPPAPRVYTS